VLTYETSSKRCTVGTICNVYIKGEEFKDETHVTETIAKYLTSKLYVKTNKLQNKT
jgi:hypothetical protein